MKRHVVLGRFGSGDRIRIPTGESEVAAPLPFVTSKQRLNHGIGYALDDLARLGIFPSEIGVDLLVLAAHVHAADIRISRSTESQDTWTREIRLVVPVSDPVRWTRTIRLLQRLLDFLTGDRWTIGFRARPARFQTIMQPKPLELIPPRFDGVALFSGGLDSLIAAIDILERGVAPLFVSHAGEGATSDAQKILFQGLKEKYSGQDPQRLRIWMDFRDWHLRKVPSEKTTRGRSFLFIALGVFAGTGYGHAFTVAVPENGLIALNVPLDPLRLGALSTRTTHPFYLARWNDLLAALGISGHVENPYWNRTKGEMVTACANRRALRRLVASSLSCSSPTKGRWQGRGPEHCGYCLPCLIRRAALNHGPRAVDPTRYALRDLSANVLDTRQAEGQQVRSLQLAIERLRANPGLATLLIQKAGPLSGESPARQAELADVYRRGLEEVAALLHCVQTKPS